MDSFIFRDQGMNGIAGKCVQESVIARIVDTIDPAR
jgi:hypothetical protein